MAEVPLFASTTPAPEASAPPAYDERPEPDETPEQRAKRIIAAARACVEAWETAENTNRSEQAIDLRFKAGDQWDAGIVAERSVPGRELPCLTFNEIFPIGKQTTNDFLQNKPGVQVLSLGGGTDDTKAAEVRAGMLRYITYASKGQAALEVAFESEVDIGLGFVQLYTEYVRDDSFSQAIVLGAITDPFSVYYDTQSTARDGSDAQECVVLDRMRRSDFAREYPDAEATQMRLTARGAYGDWLTQDTVYVAGYYCLEYDADLLYMLNDGQTVWHSRLSDPQIAGLVQQIGFRPDMVREVQRRRVKYYKLTAVDLLEEHTLPGRHIPVVPFHGNVMLVDDAVKRFGMIRALRDPQQVENWAETTKAVLVGLQPKAPWVGPEGFMGDGAQRAAWEASNNENVVALEYSRTGLDGLPIVEPPQRQPFPAVPAALVEMRESARQYMRALSGVGQPAQLTAANPRSGSSLREEDSQASMANYHYMANAKLSLLHIWQICLDWIPTYYTAAEVAQLLGEDGQVSTQVVNQRQQVPGPQGMIEQVLHDLSQGDFAAALTTGPNYETKRQEASDKLLQLAGRGWTKILDVGGSDVVRSLNMPGGETIAKKLAMTEPHVPGEDMDPAQALPVVLGQLQQVQQQAQQLNAHAQQVEQAAAQLTEENRELRMQQTALKAQMQGDAAEATVAQKMFGLQLQEQQNAFDKALLTMQLQVARLQEQLAQVQTRHAAQGAVHAVEKQVMALTDAAETLTEAALGPEANGTAVVVEG